MLFGYGKYTKVTRYQRHFSRSCPAGAGESEGGLFPMLLSQLDQDAVNWPKKRHQPTGGTLVRRAHCGESCLLQTFKLLLHVSDLPTDMMNAVPALRQEAPDRIPLGAQWLKKLDFNAANVKDTDANTSLGQLLYAFRIDAQELAIYVERRVEICNSYAQVIDFFYHGCAYIP